jgi:two-component system OmpR family response regulator
VTSHEIGGLSSPKALKGDGVDVKPRPQGRRTLLVVEDDEDTSDILRMWLESEVYQIVTAGDGWEAVQMALRGRYDAILLDMSLPTLDGMSILRLIRGHEH